MKQFASGVCLMMALFYCTNIDTTNATLRQLDTQGALPQAHTTHQRLDEPGHMMTHRTTPCMQKKKKEKKEIQPESIPNCNSASNLGRSKLHERAEVVNFLSFVFVFSNQIGWRDVSTNTMMQSCKIPQNYVNE